MKSRAKTIHGFFRRYEDGSIHHENMVSAAREVMALMLYVQNQQDIIFTQYAELAQTALNLIENHKDTKLQYIKEIGRELERARVVVDDLDESLTTPLEVDKLWVLSFQVISWTYWLALGLSQQSDESRLKFIATTAAEFFVSTGYAPEGKQEMMVLNILRKHGL